MFFPVELRCDERLFSHLGIMIIDYLLKFYYDVERSDVFQRDTVPSAGRCVVYLSMNPVVHMRNNRTSPLFEFRPFDPSD